MLTEKSHEVDNRIMSDHRYPDCEEKVFGFDDLERLDKVKEFRRKQVVFREWAKREMPHESS